MYFCYVDESGDCGLHDPGNKSNTGTPYFIVTGIFLAVNKWKTTLDTLKGFRKRIAREGFLQYDVEFHCSEMIDPHKVKAFTSISVAERWMLIREYADLIGADTSFNVIAVVIDKQKTTLTQSEYLTAAVTALYKAFDEFLRNEKSYGLVFLDRANENKISTHVRKLLGTGVTGESVPVRIGWVLEDPIFKISNDSLFIQSADLTAYTLKEKEFPVASRKKFNADRIFRTKLGASIYKSSEGDEDGIIRL